MKTFKTLTTAIILTVILISAQANNPASESIIESRKELQSALTEQFSQSELNWDEQKNTEVVAEICISSEGRLHIVAINGDNDCKTYVEEKLKTVKFDNKNLAGKTFIYRYKYRTH